MTAFMPPSGRIAAFGLCSAVIDGRLCRIAVPRVRRHGQRITGPLAADLAYADADDVRSLLKPERREHGWLYRQLERGFDGLLNVYEAGLKVVLRHRFVTLMVTIALTGYLYVAIPKGFFPQQDTGLIIGLSDAAQNISFHAMAERQYALLNGVMRDPAVESIGSAVGAGGGNTTVNNGRVYIQLKPASQRDPMEKVIARLRTNLAGIQGITLYMQAAQDITIGGRVSRTQYQYTLNDADPGELNRWAALFLGRIKTIPGIIDVATDQLNAGPMLDITIKRDVASSFGILPSTIDNTLDDAFGQRIVSTMYTQLNQYHVVLEVDPKFQYGPEVLNGIYVSSSTGAAVDPWSAASSRWRRWSSTIRASSHR